MLYNKPINYIFIQKNTNFFMFLNKKKKKSKRFFLKKPYFFTTHKHNKTKII